MTLQCLDQMLIRGDSTFPLFLLLALLHHCEDQLLALSTADALEQFLSDAIWRLDAAQRSQLVEAATVMAKIAPISVMLSLRCVGAQCASGLLPDALPGTAAMWRRRYDAFVTHMLLPREWVLPLEGNEHRVEAATLQWTGVVRVLSRDLPFLPCPTLSALAGTATHSLQRRSNRSRLSARRSPRGRRLARPLRAALPRLLLPRPPRRAGPRAGPSPRGAGGGGPRVAVAGAGGGRGSLSARAAAHGRREARLLRRASSRWSSAGSPRRALRTGSFSRTACRAAGERGRS